MKHWVAWVMAGAMMAGSSGVFAQQAGVVEKRDPALDTLVAADARLEMVKSGFGFTEGPVWVPQGGYLLFTDIPANVIYKLTRDGQASVYLEKAGYQGHDLWRVGFEFNNGKDPSDPKFEKFNMSGANGLALDPEGRVVIAAWAGRSVDRIEKDGKRTVLADKYEGKRFGGPNDVVVRKDGSVYFTDTYGGMLKMDKDPSKELDVVGIYMIRDGKVQRIIDDLKNPNGLTFSPDEKVFYANSGRDRYVKRYDVQPDGSVTSATMFVDMSSEKLPGITDGMKVDVNGNLWTTGAGGVWILSPDGKHLGTIRTPELAANLAFGDDDRKTLYITARTSIYKIRTNIAGLP
jgi:gluconolactonase